MKKKTIALLLVLMMVFGITCGGTIAYLTAQTDTVVNTFTVGNVAIKLDEAEIVNGEATGKRISGATKEGADKNKFTNAYHLLPGGTYTKDPTITVEAGSENAYLVAKVEVTGVNLKETALWVEEGQYVGLVGMVTGGITSATALEQKEVTYKDGTDEKTMTVYVADTYYLTQEVATDGSAVFTYYIKAAKAAGDKVELFDTITIPGAWDNTEIAKFANMKINVTAYAVQKAGFDDVLSAYHTAF